MHNTLQTITLQSNKHLIAIKLKKNASNKILRIKNIRWEHIAQKKARNWYIINFNY